MSAADVSAVIGMAWQDDTPFEAMALQFGLSEDQVIALMRAQLKARSFRVWRMRVRGRVSKHQALQRARSHATSEETVRTLALLEQNQNNNPNGAEHLDRQDNCCFWEWRIANPCQQHPQY